ncbi:MAG: hypothetical protein JOZ05_08455, partial [Acetobacteraceae bacterium]|nr:hypothetical protein [Acetobacteraceae bacterium]
LVLAPLGASAAPPPDADPGFAPWFRGLRVPGTGTSCCSIADCRPAESRIVGDHYEVFIDGKWLRVPPELILERADNPTGRAVVCWTPTAGILCFVRGPEV